MGRMEEEFIWQMAWQRGVGLAMLQTLALVLIGYVGLVVAFFRGREHSAGALCLFCLLCWPGLPLGLVIALGVGWQRAARWRMTGFMALWTALIAAAALDLTAAVVLRDLDGATVRRLFGPRQ